MATTPAPHHHEADHQRASDSLSTSPYSRDDRGCLEQANKDIETHYDRVRFIQTRIDALVDDGILEMKGRIASGQAVYGLVNRPIRNGLLWRSLRLLLRLPATLGQKAIYYLALVLCEIVGPGMLLQTGCSPGVTLTN